MRKVCKEFTVIQWNAISPSGSISALLKYSAWSCLCGHSHCCSLVQSACSCKNRSWKTITVTFTNFCNADAALSRKQMLHQHEWQQTVTFGGCSSLPQYLCSGVGGRSCGGCDTTQKALCVCVCACFHPQTVALRNWNLQPYSSQKESYKFGCFSWSECAGCPVMCLPLVLTGIHNGSPKFSLSSLAVYPTASCSSLVTPLLSCTVFSMLVVVWSHWPEFCMGYDWTLQGVHNFSDVKSLPLRKNEAVIWGLGGNPSSKVCFLAPPHPLTGGAEVHLCFTNTACARKLKYFAGKKCTWGDGSTWVFSLF